MEHPILLNIKQQFPHAEFKRSVPANCRYHIPYAVKKLWQTDSFRISKQDYDGKHTYLGLIEIKVEKKFSFIITTTSSDLFWLYQLKGSIRIKQYPTGAEHNGFLGRLQEDEYALFYSPPREYEITVEPGLHILFLFVVNSSWLQRHPITEPTHYQKLINYLRHKKDHYNITKVLPIHDEIRKEILHLLTMPDFGEMLLDSEVNTPIVRLVLISREDLKTNGIPVSRNMQNTLIQIRNYYKKQISEGLAPSITEVAQHFTIGLRQLRSHHKAVYRSSLQSYITAKRMEAAENLLIKTEESISNIAYTLGYELHNTFQKQFRIHFNMSPSEYRKRYKK